MTMRELKQVVCDEWDQFDPEAIDKLSEPTTKRFNMGLSEAGKAMIW
jgi:hypothetical protein